MPTNFKSLLADTGVKQAAVEGPDNVQFEQDFSRIAYSFLQDRAAALIPFLIGFEVVERDEDGSRAVGIFGFKIGKDLYYVPTFFVNNQIKGMDLLFSKKTNLFIPLRESWINYLLNRQAMSLGGSADESVRQDVENPNMGKLLRPPVGILGKLASDTIRDGFDTWNKLQQDTVDAFDKDAEFQKAFAGAVCRLEKKALPFEKSADTALTRFLRDAGGPKAVATLIDTIGSDIKFANAALEFYPSIEALAVTKFAAALAPKQAARISILTRSYDGNLSGEDKMRLVRDGFTIEDTREPQNKSELFNTEYVQRFMNPAEPGTYDVLLASGTTARMWVLQPANKFTPDSKAFVAVVPGSRHYFLANSTGLWATVAAEADGTVDGADDAYKQAVKLENVELGKTYVLINEDLSVTAPFKVTSVISESGERIRLGISSRYSRVFKGESATAGTWDSNRGYGAPAKCCSDDSINTLQIAEHSNGHLASSGTDVLIVPSKWKALKLEDFEDSMRELSYDAREQAVRMFRPGTMADMEEAMVKSGVHRMTVHSQDGIDYAIDIDGQMVDSRLGYKSAMVRLVGSVGLSVTAAEDVLREARLNYASRHLVKVGQTVGVTMPGIPGQPTDGSDYYTGAEMIGPQYEMLSGQMPNAPVPQDSMAPNINLGGEQEQLMGGQQNAGSLAQGAAQTGQQQVFDHAAIGGLAKLYDTNAVIDAYIPDMVKALDRVGRVLFLFYWKNEEFADRYGSEDLVELEDSLRGVFKSFGDIVLKLRQKSVDTSEADNNLVVN